MSRPLDTRIDRVEGRRMAADAEPGSAAIRPTLRAEAAMGAVIRSALARAGVDAAGATRLCFADEAAAPPVAIPVAASAAVILDELRTERLRQLAAGPEVVQTASPNVREAFAAHRS